MKITVDGNELEIPHKRIRVDALLETAGLDPLKNRLVLVNSDRRKIVEFCCLMDIIEIFEGMCFVTCISNAT